MEKNICNLNYGKGIVKLTEEQIVMLKLSESDIKEEKLIPQSQLDKSDMKWLKEL
jgi:hypothetical protein